jgi:GNAT superfamily N-acetyltransferase
MVAMISNAHGDRPCYARPVTDADIRPMRRADVARAADVIRRNDFGEREQYFAWAIERPEIRLLVVEDAGGIAATGSAAANGAVGWVGVIFVRPDRRGTGLGGRMIRAVIADLEARGCRSQVLIASPAGRPIYERLGFSVVDRQLRFHAPGMGVEQPWRSRWLRPFRRDDLGTLVGLDQSATGEDRSAALTSLATPDATWVTVDGADRPTGFFLRPPWRGGAVIAPDPDDALRLLELRRRQAPIDGQAGAGVLASNAVGRARLRAAGWTEEIANVRMVRGEPLRWNPNAIWGQLNGALG